MNAQDRIARLCGAVNEDRLWKRHMDPAHFGALASGGVNRQAEHAEPAQLAAGTRVLAATLVGLATAGAK